jgi:hypothetical protein
MKKPLLILALLLAQALASGQDKSGFVALQSGPSCPAGLFHSKNLPDGGFALTGLNVSLEGAWFFRPWLGVGGYAGMQAHPVDVGALGFEKMKEDPFLTDIYIRSEAYRSYSFYGGLFFEKVLVQRLNVTAKLLGGLFYAETPYQLYKAEYFMIGEKWYEVTAAGDYEGSFLAGLGARYYLNNCLGFSLNGEFTYHQTDFTFIQPNGNERQEIQAMAFVNILVGVVVKIN